MQRQRTPVPHAEGHETEGRALRGRWLAASAAAVVSALAGATLLGGGAPAGIPLTSPPGSGDIGVVDDGGNEVASPLAALNTLILPAPPGPGPAIPGPEPLGLRSQDDAGAAVVGVDDTTTSSSSTSTSAVDPTTTTTVDENGTVHTVPMGEGNVLGVGDCGGLVLNGYLVGGCDPRK